MSENDRSSDEAVMLPEGFPPEHRATVEILLKEYGARNFEEFAAALSADQSILVVSFRHLAKGDEERARDFAAASSPGLLVFRLPRGETESYANDMPASLRGLLAAARKRRFSYLAIERDGGAVLPGLPVFEGG